MWVAVMHSPLTKGMASGLVSAALVDIHALWTFKRWSDFTTFDWGTATFRWFLGAIGGLLTAAGYGAVIG